LAYAITITRDDAISVEEWMRAVSLHPELRPSDDGSNATNPATGERIAIPRRHGDVEMLIDGAWLPVFIWGRRGPSFKANPEFVADDGVVRVVTRQLARELGARLEGDAGETYA
jgi:hypothetical protein